MVIVRGSRPQGNWGWTKTWAQAAAWELKAKQNNNNKNQNKSFKHQVFNTTPTWNQRLICGKTKESYSCKDECAWHQVTCSSIIGALLLEPICLIIAPNNWIASCALSLAHALPGYSAYSHYIVVSTLSWYIIALHYCSHAPCLVKLHNCNIPRRPAHVHNLDHGPLQIMLHICPEHVISAYLCRAYLI